MFAPSAHIPQWFYCKWYVKIPIGMWGPHLLCVMDAALFPKWSTAVSRPPGWQAHSTDRFPPSVLFLPSFTCSKNRKYRVEVIGKKRSNILLFANWFPYHFVLKFFNFPSVLFYLGCCDRIPQTGWACSYFPQFWRLGSPRPRYQQSQCPVSRLLFLLWTALDLHMMEKASFI